MIVMMMMGNNGEDNGDVNNKKKELDMSNRTQVKQKAKPARPRLPKTKQMGAGHTSAVGSHVFTLAGPLRVSRRSLPRPTTTRGKVVRLGRRRERVMTLLSHRYSTPLPPPLHNSRRYSAALHYTS